jgi:hypothetical protein
MLLLFFSYYISTTSFYHTHRYSWGYVTHSHFYLLINTGNQPTPSHQHTVAQIYTIAFLSYIAFTLLIAFPILKKLEIIRRIYSLVRKYRAFPRYIYLPSRAPPLSSVY